jgi:hypothetical protein
MMTEKGVQDGLAAAFSKLTTLEDWRAANELYKLYLARWETTQGMKFNVGDRVTFKSGKRKYDFRTVTGTINKLTPTVAHVTENSMSGNSLPWRVTYSFLKKIS